MIRWILSQRPEWLPLIVNLVMLAIYIVKRSEQGKILYWLGACLLTVGILKMRG